jgi:tetratricopeptide (TPR) repeat protein
MCLYQLGRAPGREGLERLIQAEAALADLLDDDLDGQEWKAQLGYGLVQQRWVRLYDTRIRLSEQDKKENIPVDEKELRENRRELARRISLAESTFTDILSSGDQAVRDRLTCLVSLASLTFMRNDLEASLAHCREYEKQVTLSKDLWTDAAARFPKERPIYEAKIDGAERQEAELRDLMGSVLFKLRRFDDAEKELDIVLTLDETRASAYLSRGIIRQERGDWDRARSDYTQFLSRCGLPDNDPNVREATSRLLQVEELVDAEDDLRRKVENPDE